MVYVMQICNVNGINNFCEISNYFGQSCDLTILVFLSFFVFRGYTSQGVRPLLSWHFHDCSATSSNSLMIGRWHCCAAAWSGVRPFRSHRMT